MTNLIAIASGGALGAVLRYLTSIGVHRMFGQEFPYGTLAVNVLGSLMIGFCAVILLERLLLDDFWRAVIMIGFLGAFTTFSTFSLETLNLLMNGEIIKAALNIFLGVTLCIIAAWLGMIWGRQL